MIAKNQPKIDRLRKLEDKAQQKQIELDRIQSQWDALVEEINKEERLITYDFADVLA